MASYRQLANFGSTPMTALPIYNNDPLSLCVGSNMSQRFTHGDNSTMFGQNSTECQTFMAHRCAADWDGVCDVAADPRTNSERGTVDMGLSSGDILLRNSAMERFRVAMLSKGDQCELKTEPFFPINPSSPLISRWIGQDCVPVFAVNPSTIDDDSVMNRILNKPAIAMSMLANIRHTMKRRGDYNQLRGTRLGGYYAMWFGDL